MEVLLGFALAALVVFTVGRELFCWYWKINERLELQKRMADDLRAMRMAMCDTEPVRQNEPATPQDEIKKAFDAIIKKEGGELSAGGMTLELKRLGFPESQVEEIVRSRCYIPPAK